MRVRASIRLGVFEEIPHPRTQLVGVADYPEEIGDDWIPRFWREVVWCQEIAAGRTAGVLHKHAVTLNDEPRRTRTCEFAVDQCVCDHFTDNDFAQTSAHIPFQEKRIGQVLASEFHEAVVCGNQVNADDITVIIAVNIPDSEYGVRNVCGANVLDDILRPKQHDGCQIKTAFARLSVRPYQLCTAQELVIVHIHPRMAAFIAAVVLRADAKPL